MASLGKRHLELNEKVNASYKERAKLDDIGPDEQLSDVDRIIKINLASKYRDIIYIVNNLKSGDSLYITKALKAIWMFEKTYSDTINPEYIDQQIKPFMSEKMFKKFLNVISQNLRDDRTIDFFEYCMKLEDTKHAKKFLIFTSESYKLNAIEDPSYCIHNSLVFVRDHSFFTNFIGNSFKLADKFMQKLKGSCEHYIPWLRHLYFVNNSQYLNLMETHCASKKLYFKFGLKISKDIATKHMDRILKHPQLYIQVLEHKTLLKHCNQEKAELLAEAVFPENVSDFWSNSTFEALLPFLSKTPQENRFIIIKEIFGKKYPQDQFYTNKCFSSQMHELMTGEQRQDWAIKQVKSGEEFFGRTNDYKWYKYINFDKSYHDLKKMIHITQNKDKRKDIIVVLASTAINDEDLELLLGYFNERHMNETAETKLRFIDELLKKFNVFCFSKVCWEGFDALLHSLDVYKFERSLYHLTKYRVIAAVRHVVHFLDFGDMPEVIKCFLQNMFNYDTLYSCLKKYNQARMDSVYEYVLELHVEELKAFENTPYTSEVKLKVNYILDNVLELAKKFNKDRKLLPPLVQHFLKLHPSSDPKPKEPLLTVGSLWRDLKKDVETFNSQFPLLKNQAESYYSIKQNLRSISIVLNKLRVYFNEDVAKEWLANFVALLQDSTTASEKQTAVNAIMLLADQDYKIKLFKELAPENGKIDHVKIDPNLLEKQEAVCKFIGRSRPSIPNEVLMMYLKGDYVKYCLPIFDMYGSKLTPADRSTFIESILDKPVSIQKHGIRLAFKYCDMKTVNAMVMKIWNSTKNVSLRQNLYTALYKKMRYIDEEKEKAETFELLLKMTAEVHADDTEKVFYCFIMAEVPAQFRPAYVTQAWKVLSTLPKTEAMLKCKRYVITHLAKDLARIDRDFMKGTIDAFISDMLVERKILASVKADNDDEMWYLVVKYITDVHDIESKEKLVEDITKHYLLLRNECIRGSSFKPMANRFDRFLNDLTAQYWIKTGSFAEFNRFYNIIIQILSSIALWERYAITMDLKMKMLVKLVKEEALNEKFEWKVIAARIGEEMAKLIRETVDKNEFYETQIESFMEIVYSSTSSLSAEFCNKTHNDFDLEVVKKLLETDMRETYLVAVKLISNPHNNCYNYSLLDEKLLSVFNKIIASNYNDVKAVMDHLKYS